MWNTDNSRSRSYILNLFAGSGRLAVDLRRPSSKVARPFFIDCGTDGGILKSGDVYYGEAKSQSPAGSFFGDWQRGTNCHKTSHPNAY